MDKIIKALAFDKNVRLYIAIGTNTIAEIQRRLQSTSEATIALGRLALATSMLGAMESYDAKVYTRIEGKGPIGRMYADADAYGHVRAYAQNPQVVMAADLLEQQGVSGIVGADGFLYVSKDLGLKRNFDTQIELVSGELGEDFAQYFAISQQIPSAVGLGVLMQDGEVRLAAGFIAQVLPDAPMDVMEQLSDNIAQLPSLLTFLQHNDVESLLGVMSNDSAEVIEQLPLQFKCSCSKERFLDALAALPLSEIKEMLEDEQDEEIICQYCHEAYYVTNDDLQLIVQQVK